jgi:hypothetical protein
MSLEVALADVEQSVHEGDGGEYGVERLRSEGSLLKGRRKRRGKPFLGSMFVCRDTTRMEAEVPSNKLIIAF